MSDQDFLRLLPRTPATAVKKLGWKGVMRELNEVGRLVVSNHNTPEAVLLTTAEYERLVSAARQAVLPDPLKVLRERFDARLAGLAAPDAGDRLRALMQTPGALASKACVGDPTW